MNKIEWCLDKPEGLFYVGSNENLVSAYLKKSDDALESMRILQVKDWKISTAYYAIYFSLYALLMKIGFKSEIHSCTLEFVRIFLRDFFNDDDLRFISSSFKARIDSQYYVDRSVPDEQYNMMISFVPRFVVKCKELLPLLTEKKIKEIISSFEKYSSTLCSIRK